MLVRLYVNNKIAAQNKRRNAASAVIIVKTYKETHYTKIVELPGHILKQDFDIGEPPHVWLYRIHDQSRIYVERERVKRSLAGEVLPCITVEHISGVKSYTDKYEIGQGFWFKQNFENPVCSGARLYIEGELSEAYPKFSVAQR